MSIRVTSQVWRGSQHKSGHLLILLALADHADENGQAWPGIPLLARKARLSERHARRCLNELIASGEVKILLERAPSGKNLYQIQLDQLTPESLCVETPATESMTRMSETSDAGDNTYIKEPSGIKPSLQPSSKTNLHHFNPLNPHGRRRRESKACGLVSAPKQGF